MTTARTSIRRNVVYGFTSWFVPIVLGVVTTPVIVHSLGTHEYGIYSLIAGFVAYSFYFNIGRAITKYVSEYRATGETEKIRDVITATLVINVCVGILGLVAVILLAPWVVTDVFRIDEAMRGQSITALRVSAFVILSLMLGQVFHAVLQGVNRFDVFSKIQNATSLLLMVGNVVLVVAGYGLLALFYWNLFTTTLNGLLAAVSARRLLPEFGISKRVERPVVKQVIRYSSAVVGTQIVANVVLLFERGWITAKLGPESLTYYVVPMTLGMLLHGFIYSLMMTLFPLASELSADSDRENLLRLYKKASKVACFLVVYAAGSLILLNHTALTVWLGAELSVHSAELLVYHAITFGIVSIAVIAFQIAEGLGFPTFGLWTTLAILIIAVPLMILLIDPYGNIGVAAARLAGFSLMIPAIAYLERWAFGSIQFRFWTSTLGSLLLALAIAGAVEKFLESVLPTNWLTFGLILTAGGLVYCLALLPLGFIGSEEKQIFRQLLQRARG